MARLESTLTIPSDDPGRDKGKSYFIREVPADQGERFAIRMFFALTNAGAIIPEDIQDRGLAGLAFMGYEALANLKWEMVAHLFAEMFDCVEFIPDIRNPQVKLSITTEGAIEEISTRLKLRKAIFALHVIPFTSAAPSTSESVAATPTNTSSSDTPTSPTA